MKTNKLATIILIALTALLAPYARSAELVIEWDAIKGDDIQRYELRLTRTDAEVPEKRTITASNGVNIVVSDVKDGVWDVDLVAVRTAPPESDGRPELCWRRIISSRKTVMVFGAKSAEGPWRLLGDVVAAPVHLRLWPRSVLSGGSASVDRTVTNSINLRPHWILFEHNVHHSPRDDRWFGFTVPR